MHHKATIIPLVISAITITYGNSCNSFISSTGIDRFDVITEVDCNTNKIKMNITVNDYDSYWWGIVFGDDMIGHSLQYYSDSNSESTAVLEYVNMRSKLRSSFKYDSSKDWDVLSKEINGDTFNIIFEQDLDDVVYIDNFDMINVRFAWGEDLRVTYHYGRKTDILNLVTGTVEKDKHTLEIIHGIIMWIAWAILAPIGIFGSAFRWLFNSKSKGFWFIWIHRPIQYSVVILTIIAAGLIVYSTEKENNKHFGNNHMIIGLVTVIIAILQPIMAYFRPHAPTKDEKEKTNVRLIWEYSHKSLGYSALILGLVACYLGLRIPIINEDTLSYIHLFGWCIALFLMYIALTFIGHYKSANVVEVSNNTSNGIKNATKDAEAETEKIAVV